MTFSSDILHKLAADLPREHIATRKQGYGAKEITLSYIEGWYAIKRANDIFGFGSWHREVRELVMRSESKRLIGKKPTQREGFGVTYTATVRVTMFHEGGSCFMDGSGAGHGIDIDLGLAHESAIKEADTDAFKRAMINFGNQFGLCLYDKQKRGVSQSSHAVKRDEPDAWPTFEAMVRACSRPEELTAYMDSQKEMIMKWPQGWRQQARELCESTMSDLKMKVKED